MADPFDDTALAAFDRRLAAAITRHAEGARDPRQAAVIASEAIRRARRRPWHDLRTWRLMPVVAALLAPLLLLALAATRPTGPSDAHVAGILTRRWMMTLAAKARPGQHRDATGQYGSGDEDWSSNVLNDAEDDAEDVEDPGSNDGARTQPKAPKKK